MKSKNIVTDMTFANNFKKTYKFRNNGKSHNFKAGLTFLQGREEDPCREATNILHFE